VVSLCNPFYIRFRHPSSSEYSRKFSQEQSNIRGLCYVPHHRRPRDLSRSGLGGEQSTGGDLGLLPLATVDRGLPLAPRENLEHPLDAADPHQLIMMLLDGVLSRFVQARACSVRAQRHECNRHLERAVAIVGELRASLDLSRGPLARNLDDLYKFVNRQLLLCKLTSEVKPIESSASILQEIRFAWAGLQPF
jgi:flagellar protein FliS